jgi:hypothetical protein
MSRGIDCFTETECLYKSMQKYDATFQRVLNYWALKSFNIEVRRDFSCAENSHGPDARQPNSDQRGEKPFSGGKKRIKEHGQSF